MLGRHLGGLFNIPLNLPTRWREETSGCQPSKGHETQQSPAQNTTVASGTSPTCIATEQILLVGQQENYIAETTGEFDVPKLFDFPWDETF